MSLTADQDAYFRSRLGSGYDDTDAEERLTRIKLDNPDAENPEAMVAAEVIEERLADMALKPATFAVDGYSESRGENIKLMQEQLTIARAEAGESTSGWSVQIVQPERYRTDYVLDTEEMWARRRLGRGR
ncbi:MAG TPA: hypothetical protein VNN79_15655 [Actinomycetota bacterium]|nr:hypothetical protein [Actinomycetota bacterium]